MFYYYTKLKVYINSLCVGNLKRRTKGNDVVRLMISK